MTEAQQQMIDKAFEMLSEHLNLLHLVVDHLHKFRDLLSALRNNARLNGRIINREGLTRGDREGGEN